jgi:acyl-coenzyme A synthetase/AMP-(fatty) acid ligase
MLLFMYLCPFAQVQGEAITALVFPDPKQATPHDKISMEQALRQHCLHHLAPYQSPRRFVFLDAPLPRNAMGKVNKKELLHMFLKEML